MALPSAGALIPNFHDIFVSNVSIQGPTAVQLQGFAADTEGLMNPQYPLTITLDNVVTDTPDQVSLTTSDTTVTLTGVNMPIFPSADSRTNVIGTPIRLSVGAGAMSIGKSFYSIDLGEPGSIVNSVPPAPVSNAHSEVGMRACKMVKDVLSQALALSDDPVLRGRVAGQKHSSLSVGRRLPGRIGEPREPRDVVNTVVGPSIGAGLVRKNSKCFGTAPEAARNDTTARSSPSACVPPDVARAAPRRGRSAFRRAAAAGRCTPLRRARDNPR